MVLIAVHGVASRSLPAERGTVRLAVEVEHDDRATAVRQAAALHERFVAEAEAHVASGAATRWGSEQIRIRTEHRYDGAAETPSTVQVAAAGVEVRFRDLAALSTWILDAGAVAGTTVERVDWSVTAEHRAAAERELRVEAVRDALTRAEAYASAIGGAGVVIQAVWEDGLRPAARPQEARWAAQAMAERAAQPGFALRPDDIEIAAAVTADFVVEQAG